jgi:hypothetical protein
MKKMTEHDKAIRLLEGGIVEIQANWFRLKRLPDDYDDNPCVECSLDSICRQEHINVCTECDAISNKTCCLLLASESR